MIFDTHAHLDDEAFDNDRDILINSFKENNVGIVVNNASDIESSKSSIELSNKYDFIYAAIGVHPSSVLELDDDKMNMLKEMSKDKKVVAIGEIGLDYHYDDDPAKEVQQYWFKRQLQIARECKLPVIIHSRDAAEDTFNILKEEAGNGLVADIHCYSYSPEMAKEYVKLGFFIGVGGVVTFKNGKKLKETVKQIPIENIVLETDCPYMAPEPFRGTRNDSRNIKYVIEEISKIKNISPDEVEQITYNNARRLYKLD